mgnify:CR=1 FL=1
MDTPYLGDSRGVGVNTKLGTRLSRRYGLTEYYVDSAFRCHDFSAGHVASRMDLNGRCSRTSGGRCGGVCDLPRGIGSRGQDKFRIMGMGMGLVYVLLRRWEIVVFRGMFLRRYGYVVEVTWM